MKTDIATQDHVVVNSEWSCSATEISDARISELTVKFSITADTSEVDEIKFQLKITGNASERTIPQSIANLLNRKEVLRFTIQYSMGNSARIITDTSSE